MKLTVENVEKLIPGALVTEEPDGIRIYKSEYLPDDLPMIGDLMRCAAALNLDPSQIEDKSEFIEGTDWGGWTGKESDIITFHVLIRWPTVADKQEE